MDRLTTAPEVKHASAPPPVEKTFFASVQAITDDSTKLDYIGKYCLVRRLARSSALRLDSLHVIDDAPQIAAIVHETMLPHDPIKTTPGNEFLSVVLPQRIEYMVSRGIIHPRETTTEYWLDDFGRDVLRLGIPLEDSIEIGSFADFMWVTYPNGRDYGYKRTSDAWDQFISSSQFERARTRYSGTKIGRTLPSGG